MPECSAETVYDLSNVCPSCGVGHVHTPCSGGRRCECRCRSCDEPMRHSIVASLSRGGASEGKP